MAAIYTTQFMVEGQSPFPYDMLRYDACYPYSQGDIWQIDKAEEHEPARVMLSKLHVGKEPHITRERWASFQWKVTSINTRKVAR